MTRCKDCALFNGDCGHHYIDRYGHVDYTESSLAVENRVGDCEYFKETRSKRNICIDSLTMQLTGQFPTKEHWIRVAITMMKNMTDADFLKYTGDKEVEDAVRDKE